MFAIWDQETMKNALIRNNLAISRASFKYQQSNQMAPNRPATWPNPIVLLPCGFTFSI